MRVLLLLPVGLALSGCGVGSVVGTVVSAPIKAAGKAAGTAVGTAAGVVTLNDAKVEHGHQHQGAKPAQTIKS